MASALAIAQIEQRDYIWRLTKEPYIRRELPEPLQGDGPGLIQTKDRENTWLLVTFDLP
jgi:hypothetical protein